MPRSKVFLAFVHRATLRLRRAATGRDGAVHGRCSAVGSVGQSAFQSGGIASVPRAHQCLAVGVGVMMKFLFAVANIGVMLWNSGRLYCDYGLGLAVVGVGVAIAWSYVAWRWVPRKR